MAVWSRFSALRWRWKTPLIAFLVTLGVSAAFVVVAFARIDSSAGVADTGAFASQAGEAAVVRRIVDGDTIEVSVSGRTEPVHLVLIDSPEIYGTNCYGPEARAFTKSLLREGTHVRLERDVSDRDRFDRLLRYVYLTDGRMVNEEIVAGGYGHLSRESPDVKHVDRIQLAEQHARDGGRGLWAACGSTPVQAGVDTGCTCR